MVCFFCKLLCDCVCGIKNEAVKMVLGATMGKNAAVIDIGSDNTPLMELLDNIPTPKGSDSIQSWANFVSTSINLHGKDTAAIQFLQSNDTDYEKNKLDDFVRFFKLVEVRKENVNKNNNTARTYHI